MNRHRFSGCSKVSTACSTYLDSIFSSERRWFESDESILFMSWQHIMIFRALSAKLAYLLSQFTIMPHSQMFLVISLWASSLVLFLRAVLSLKKRFDISTGYPATQLIAGDTKYVIQVTARIGLLRMEWYSSFPIWNQRKRSYLVYWRFLCSEPTGYCAVHSQVYLALNHLMREMIPMVVSKTIEYIAEKNEKKGNRIHIRLCWMYVVPVLFFKYIWSWKRRKISKTASRLSLLSVAHSTEAHICKCQKCVS
jgi:hypothetical protein